MVIIIVAGSSRCSQAHVETCYLSSRKDDDNSGSSVEGVDMRQWVGFWNGSENLSKDRK
jgi:hypothetical protein